MSTALEDTKRLVGLQSPWRFFESLYRSLPVDRAFLINIYVYIKYFGLDRGDEQRENFAEVSEETSNTPFGPLVEVNVLSSVGRLPKEMTEYGDVPRHKFVVGIHNPDIPNPWDYASNHDFDFACSFISKRQLLNEILSFPTFSSEFDQTLFRNTLLKASGIFTLTYLFASTFLTLEIPRRALSVSRLHGWRPILLIRS